MVSLLFKATKPYATDFGVVYCCDLYYHLRCWAKQLACTDPVHLKQNVVSTDLLSYQKEVRYGSGILYCWFTFCIINTVFMGSLSTKIL